jgi:tetratricopeptide (TPR) repeat protein
MDRVAFGRYRALEPLGAGGMGTVLLGYDPDLDRRVAIKVLRPDAIAEGSKLIEHTIRLDGSGQPRDLVRERLLAEGRALARLSHPNLIAVFEVGEVDDQVFLVMEHVEGGTLEEWCAGRGVREVVRAYLQAGRGLAAAHQAELVHGDFKPANALVDASGRVRVIDFGLARAVGTRDVGRMAGTPRFMAPELLSGSAADPRSDQYAFATGLYNALYGEWPAPEPDLIAGIASTDPPREPSRRRGPRWLEKALLRALAPRPADRFPSMDALLAVLERPARSARVALAVSGAALVGAAALFVAARGGAPASDVCGGGPARLATVWNQDAMDRIRAGLEKTGRAHAAATATLAVARLEDLGRSWLAEHRRACQATRVSGEQSEELLDRRMACLERSLDRLATTGQILAAADAKVVDRAVELVAALDPPADCGDVERLLAGFEVPADPAARARLAEVERMIDQTDAERRAGRLEQAADSGRDALEAARGLGLSSLVAEAGLNLGRVHEFRGDLRGAEAELRAAMQLASDDEITARIQIDLARIIGYRQQRVAEGRLLADVAASAVDRLGERLRARLRARLMQVKGDIAYGAGEAPEAERMYRAVLELRRASLEPNDVAIADIESRVAVALDDLGRSEEAEEHHRRALEIRQDALGPTNPVVADALANLGRSYLKRDKLGEAHELIEQSLAIIASVPEYNARPNLLTTLGEIETDLGRFDEAQKNLEAGLAAREARLGPDHPDVAHSLYNLAYVHLARGELDRALAMQERARAIQGKSGDGSPVYALSLCALSELRGRLGHMKQALALAEEAEAIFRGKLGAEHEVTAEAYVWAGVALVGLGRAAEAIAELEIAARRRQGPERRAEAALVLAEALWDSGGDRARALALVREALATLDRSGPRWEYRRSRGRAWLARRE